MKDIWINFVNLIYSVHKPEWKPNANRHWSCASDHNQNLKFLPKVQNWKPLFRLIQGIIHIPLASWSFTDHIPIQNIHQKARNRYTELNIFHENFIIVFYNLCIFMTFQLLILVPGVILKLTHMFDWIFASHTRLCHNCFLGFTELEIGVSQIRQNWDTSMP